MHSLGRDARAGHPAWPSHTPGRELRPRAHNPPYPCGPRPTLPRQSCPTASPHLPPFFRAKRRSTSRRRLASATSGPLSAASPRHPVAARALRHYGMSRWSHRNGSSPCDPTADQQGGGADPHAIQCQQVWGRWGHQLGQQGIEVRLSPHPGPASGARGSAGRSWWRRSPGPCLLAARGAAGAAGRAASCWRATAARGCRSSSGTVELRWRIWLRVLTLTDRAGRLAATSALLASRFPSRVLAAPLAAAGQRRPCRLDGIQRIRLAGPSAGLAVAALRRAISSARPLMTRCSLPQASTSSAPIGKTRRA